jgi:transcriptional regulator with XRE-family HTH domain
MKKTPAAVAQRIKAEAARQRIPQAVLAETIGVNQQNISRRLTGKGPITVVEAALFADLLGVSVAWLFGETEIREPAPAPVPVPA